ncbi:hypothetical protein IWQ60_005143 [Tieghemiomyces parasiticus]|uniref:TPPC8 first Ig-like domain-containing protein n=1 Tax=Tieghemiomyces parasiticus TaxID=78921 RepID=A0A9W8DYQ7_9FUNG|nr:hypothetical protein IWQ60_005143 [Tieghemiomyces parasiticus]
MASVPPAEPIGSPARPSAGNPAEPVPRGQEYVLKALCPRILVLSSPEADTIVRQLYHLDRFADLLKPFGSGIPLQCPLQDGQGQPYILETLNVRFAATFTRTPVDPNEGPRLDVPDALVTQSSPLETIMDRVAAAMGETELPADLRTDLAAADVDVWAPWYADYRRTALPGMGVMEHETFAHPVAVIYVVASSHPDPVKAYFTLNGSATAIDVRTRSAAGPDLPVLHVMVHDEAQISLAETEVKFEHTRRTIGQPCYLLKLNAHRTHHDLIPELGGQGPHEDVNCTALWTQHQRVFGDIAYAPLPANHPPQTAAEGGQPSASSPPPLSITPPQQLAAADLAALRGFVKLFLNRYVLMHMQRCIRDLTEQVANARRGITGRLFTAGRKYFGNQNRPHLISAGNAAAAAAGGGPYVYHAESAEAKLRKLADYAFMLGDYRLALSIYQTAKRDYAADKMAAYLAGAQEMIGVCKLLTLPAATRAEYDGNFDEAAVLYARCRLPRFVRRSALLYYELLHARDQYVDAAAALTRAGLARGAVGDGAFLLEQAALCHLKANPPHPRKFALHFVLAARQFARDRYPTLAARDYRITATLFARAQWPAARDHVYQALGEQALQAHNYRAAVEYYFRLLAETAVISLVGADPATDDPPPTDTVAVVPASLRTAPEIQARYLAELLHLYGQNLSAFATANSRVQVPDLAVPLVPARSARVSLAPGEAALQDSLLDWVTGKEVLDGPGASERRCAVGEPVTVTLTIGNPLLVELVLQNVAVVCMYSPDGEDPVDSEAELTYEAGVVQEVKLAGGSEVRVALTVVPQRAGAFRVTGLHYLLMGIVPCSRTLHRRGARLNLTKEQRLHRTYAPDTALTFRAVLDLPAAVVRLPDVFPEVLQSGECQPVTIELTNRGPIQIDLLRFRFSHPSFFFVGDLLHPAANLYDGLVGAAGEEAGQGSTGDPRSSAEPVGHFTVANQLTDRSTVELHLVGAQAGNTTPWDHRRSVPIAPLAPGETLRLPLWVRGDRVGQHAFTVHLGYGTGGPSGSPVLRTVKAGLGCVVQPSLKINAFVRPDAESPREQSLGIEVENLQPDTRFRLVQVTAVSPHFTLARPVGMADPAELGPRQAVFLTFHVRPVAGLEATAEFGGDDVQPDSPAVHLDHGAERFTADAVRQLVLSTPRRWTKPPALTLYTTDVCFGSRRLRCDQDPLRDFVYNARVAWRRKHLRTTYATLSAVQFPELFTTFESHDLDIALFWEQTTGPADSVTVRRGHHAITGINLGVPLNYLRGVLPPLPDPAAVGGGETTRTPLTPTQMFSTPSTGSVHAAPNATLTTVPRAPERSEPLSSHLFGNILFAETLREKWALVSELADPPRYRAHPKPFLQVTLVVLTEEEDKDATKLGEDGTAILIATGASGDETQRTHTFTTQGPLLLPVWISVRNATWCARIEGRLTLHAAAPVRRGLPSRAPASMAVPPAIWVGATDQDVMLEPGAETTFVARLCVPQPGTYNINSWRVVGQQQYLLDRMLPPKDPIPTVKPAKSSGPPRPTQVLLDQIGDTVYPVRQAAHGAQLVTVSET